MPLKNWCSIHARWSKSSLKHSTRFCGIFPSLKQNFIAYRSSKVSDCIFEIHQLWQSGFSRVYSNCCCSCSFKLEIIKIGQSSHKMYSNNILNFQESMTILNACTKKSVNLLNVPHTYIYIEREINRETERDTHTQRGLERNPKCWVCHLKCWLRLFVFLSHLMPYYIRKCMNPILPIIKYILKMFQYWHIMIVENEHLGNDLSCCSFLAAHAKIASQLLPLPL